MSMIEMFPAFVAYAVTATLLCLNLLVTWNASGGVRAKSKTTPNPEDPSTFGPKLQVTDDEPESVARAMRVHRNATATIVPFLFLALIYVLLGAPATLAWVVFGSFTAARIIHSIVYSVGVQPWRTISYTASQLAILALVVLIARAAVP